MHENEENRVDHNGFYAVYFLETLDQETTLKTLSESIPAYEDGGTFAKNVKTVVLSKVTSCTPSVGVHFTENLGGADVDASDRDNAWAIFLITFPTCFNNSSNGNTTDSSSRALIVVALLCQDLEIFECYHDEVEQFWKNSVDEIPADLGFTEKSKLLEEKASSWFGTSVLYLTRSIEFFGARLRNLLHAILSGVAVSFKLIEETSVAKTKKAELERFAQLCSVRSITTLRQDEEVTETHGPMQDQANCEVSISADGRLGDLNYTKSNSYAEKWADVLIRTAEQSVMTVAKHLITSFKLRAVQDFKYLLRQLAVAENDHYALFSTVDYLRKTQNVDALLNLLKISCRDSGQLKIVNLMTNYLLTQGEYPH